jgi:orotidine-5'-phosphate decarboxylase
MADLKAKDRLIVALDVPTPQEAFALVSELKGVVSFYKVGLELLMGGGMHEILTKLTEEHQVFVDLKLPGDVGETVKRVVRLASALKVRFLTLSASADEETVKAASEGRGSSDNPKLLFVSYLSSLDQRDFARLTGHSEGDFDSFLISRSENALNAGCDGFIASGDAIRLLRTKFPEALIVSPGIRLPGDRTDDHKRLTTPSEALQMGANYLVVGRPIRNASNRHAAALRIIDEMEKGEPTESQRTSTSSLSPPLRTQPALS